MCSRDLDLSVAKREAARPSARDEPARRELRGNYLLYTNNRRLS
jgi:hypothetical protein